MKLNNNTIIIVVLQEESLLGRFGKLSTVVKSKSALVKEKMINYIKNEGAPHDR